MNIFEMNNAHKDAEAFTGKFHKNSPIVEVFSAWVDGKSLDKFGKQADASINYIKELGDRANNGDPVAVAELNTLRRFVIEPKLAEEMKLLGVFGSYQAIGWDETAEIEAVDFVGEKSRIQAENGDVVFPIPSRKRVPVPFVTISGGMVNNYRALANGNSDFEAEQAEQVRTDIRNRATAYVINQVYDAVKNAGGVNYMFEAAGLTKVGVDDVLRKVRRYGKPTIAGSYALVSQLNNFAGFIGKVDTTTITGVSERTMNEIADTGLLGMYNGAVVSELNTGIDYSRLNADGTDYASLIPEGLGLVLPNGGRSPIRTFTRGGLTSFSGNDPHTGTILTRFDLSVGAGVAPGRENEVGILYDTDIGGLE